MSTLSIATPRVAPESEVDARFDALVRAPSLRSATGRDGAAFETVFDLDYYQPLTVPAPADPEPAASQPRARIRRTNRVRVAAQRPARTALRLTRRGRLVLVLAFLGLAVALMIPMAGWATASLTGGTPEPVRVVEVGPGDTLYGIAAELAEPGRDPRDGAPHPGAQLAARRPDQRGPEARRPPRLSARPATRWADQERADVASTRPSVRGKSRGGTDTLGPTPLGLSYRWSSNHRWSSSERSERTDETKAVRRRRAPSGRAASGGRAASRSERTDETKRPRPGQRPH